MKKYLPLVQQLESAFLFLLTLSFILISCSDDEEKPADLPLPVVTNINPASGAAELQVIITGNNFSEEASKNKVLFNGKAATIISSTKTQITTKVPAEAGTGVVTVEVEGKAVQGPVFTFISSPEILDITPKTAFVGDTITITGKYFGNDATANVVQINGQTYSPISVSSTTIKIKLTSAFTKGIVSVTTGGTTVSSTIELNVYEAATVAEVTPLSGPKTTVVTIKGTGFSELADENTVTFNGKKASIISAIATQLKVEVPPAVGDGAVLVEVRGRKVAGKFEFKYVWTRQIFAGSNNAGYLEGEKSFALFNTPKGIAVDNNGNVFINDSKNTRIRKIDKAGMVSTLAGWEAGGSADGVGSSARFFDLRGIAVDIDNTLYASDHNQIRKITSAGVVSTIAGYPIEGDAEGKGDGARFYSPAGVAVDKNKNVYVADIKNHKIKKITPNGVVTVLAGSTAGYKDGNGTSAQFSSPIDIAIDQQGNLFVADQGNFSIRKITPEGVVSTVAKGLGLGDGPLEQARFLKLQSITCDSRNNLYVEQYDDYFDTFYHSIRLITPSGMVSTILTGFFGGVALAVDSEGAIYVTQSNNILKVD